MPTFQVTCSELVWVDRTYVIEAESGSAAWDAIEKSRGGDNLVDEQMQDTHAFHGVRTVHDENGNDVEV